MNENRDIFDRIMEWPVLRIFRPFYQKHKEGLLYLFFGGLTVLLAIAVFALLYLHIGINELTANAVSWIVGVTFSFVTNRIWVFKAKTRSTAALVRQALSFYAARVGTLLLQEFLIYLFVTKLEQPGVFVKICTEAINIILNYLISKWVIFKRR